MRGSHDDTVTEKRTLGIIPAHAGLTYSSFFRRPRTWDHPRACGAHINVTLRSDAAEGSSPRMRGSPVMVLCMQLLTGIIPAHAGLTPAWRTFSAMIRDHPRACGAHLAFSRLQHMTAGSSPRMRGSLVSIGDACVDVGIIPAHAGLTYSCRPKLP